MRVRRIVYPITSMVLLLAELVLLTACQPDDPILVGFVTNLKGPTSELGIHARDAAILAFEQQNARDGIFGRRLELLVKNCARTRDAALVANRAVLDSGVVAVLGLTTSDIATFSVELYNQRHVVVISPTGSTTDLTGIDDYFFRVRGDASQTAARLGAYAFEKAGVSRIAAALDKSNTQYAGRWFGAFSKSFQQAGGVIIDKVEINVESGFFRRQVVDGLLAAQPDGVVLVAGAMDAAMICQQLRKRGYSGSVFFSGWALTPDLAVHGGSAVEGGFAAQPFDPQYDGQPWGDFRAKFADRFGYEPGFAAMHSYDAALLLFDAPAKSIEGGLPLKDALLKTGKIGGLQGEVIIDRNGDAMHHIWMQTIKNGQLVRVD